MVRPVFWIAIAIGVCVWFAMRWPSSTANGAPANAAKNFSPPLSGANARDVAMQQNSASKNVATQQNSPNATAAGTVLVHGAWGGGPEQFGRRRDPESNPEAPMAIAAGAHGDFAIVDQVNRRISRFHDGKLSATIALGGDTVQDLALLAGGRTAVLDRLADGNVQLYDAAGKLSNELSLDLKGGAVTGLFADDDGLYVERAHNQLFRIADANGDADPERPPLLGRPSRDGKLLLAAGIAARGSTVATVRAFDRASGRPAWTQAVAFGAPILQLVMLDSDAHGRVYLAADTGAEAAAAPFAIAGEALEVARLGAGGAPSGMLALPPFPTADETFRPLTVDDDGTLYVMVAGDSGLDVVRYEFP